jgi:TonB family protein
MQWIASRWMLRSEACVRCFAVALAGALAFGQSAGATAPSDTDPPSAVSAPDPGAVRNNVHLSDRALQAIFLNGVKLGAQKAARSAQVTSCRMAGWYADQGTVQVVQLVKSSGLPMVDQACIQGMIGQRLEGISPGETGGRTYFSIRWLFDRKAEEEDDRQRPQVKVDPSIPQLPASGGIHPLPNYPADAFAQHAHGICKMHITVSATGAVSSIEITQSTGTGSLDDACKEAINKSTFVPATDGKEPVSGTTDVAILWRLPRS